jgi:hypothetical protein
MKPQRLNRSGSAYARRRPYCGGQRFESPQLHQVVRANRRDFPGSEIARHFRNLCEENRDALTAVPEVSTWAMMLIGFAGLGFAGYRRSRQCAITA